MPTLAINDYSLFLLLSGLFTGIMSVVVFSKIGGAVRWFAFMMLAIGIWGFAYGCELFSTTLEQMLFWIRIEYIGIATLPTLWILFIFKFTGKDHWVTNKSILLLSIEPILTLIFVYTNSYHHLHYSHVSVDTTGPFPLLNIDAGPWYIFNTLYFYFFNAWGLYLLIIKFKTADPIYKRQNNILVYATVIPWLVNFVYLFNIRPLKHIDLTPFAFIAFSTLVSFGLLRFKLFNIIPVAREKIIEALREGVIVIDTYDRVIDINPQMKRNLQGYHSTFIGLDINDIFPLTDELKKVISDRYNSTTEIKLKINDTLRTFEVSTTSLFEKGTIFSGLILLFKDITERNLSNQKLKEQSEQLITLNNLKDRLFSIISHDLRSPLNSLKETIFLTQEGSLNESDFKIIIPELSKNIEYTSELLENLLYWSKSQLKGEVIDADIFDVYEVIKEKLEFFDRKAKEKGIELNFQLSKNTFAYADKNMIRIVIRNLMANAIKFCSKGNQISIRSTSSNNRITLIIEDTGIGISQINIDKVLNEEVFSTEGTAREQGTGLGLILCQDFIKKNNGQFYIQSEVGVGSKFSIELPSTKN